MGLIRIAMLTFFAAVVSCQTLIDLGDEPTLGCGLARPLGPECDACLQTRCCEKSLACSQDAVCKQTTEGCITGCFTPECAIACKDAHPENKALDEYFRCALDCPAECTPTGTCKLLGECCSGLRDETERHGCARSARSEDQTVCESTLELFGCQGSGGAGGE
jgi:hypothetical protein